MHLSRPLALLLLSLAPALVRADLPGYVHKDDPAAGWKLVGKSNHPLGTVYDLALVSQVWQGIKWEHQLQVVVPTGVQPTQTLFLWNQGGRAGAGNTLFAMQLAQKMKAPCAFLFQIPNQPLLGDKKEDGLIAETFVRYLDTGDESWPLLFPMVKSLVKAMDALEAFSKQEWPQPVTGFVVSGASKRGWTTWLTAAVDPRVKGIAPLVIDTLNMRKQLPHQVASYGGYSDQIADYTSRGLVPIPNKPQALRLWRMVDPYTYRDKFTMPKFLVLGANDPYWTVDALNLYWDALPGEKWVLYVPNAGHNLQQTVDGKPDLSRALGGLAAIGRHMIHGMPLPKLAWKHDDAEGKARLTVEATPTPVKARLWVAESATMDFRNCKWVEQPAMVENGKVEGTVERPAAGYKAFFAELQYETDGLTYYLSTQIRVTGK